MTNRINIDDILKRNPGVNREQLEEATKLFNILRENGVQKKGYDLAPPYERRRTLVRDHRASDLGLSRDLSDTD